MNFRMCFMNMALDVVVTTANAWLLGRLPRGYRIRAPLGARAQLLPAASAARVDNCTGGVHPKRDDIRHRQTPRRFSLLGLSGMAGKHPFSRTSSPVRVVSGMTPPVRNGTARIPRGGCAAVPSPPGIPFEIQIALPARLDALQIGKLDAFPSMCIFFSFFFLFRSSLAVRSRGFLRRTKDKEDDEDDEDDEDEDEGEGEGEDDEGEDEDEDGEHEATRTKMARTKVTRARTRLRVIPFSLPINHLGGRRSVPWSFHAAASRRRLARYCGRNMAGLFGGTAPAVRPVLYLRPPSTVPPPPPPAPLPLLGAHDFFPSAQ